MIGLLSVLVFAGCTGFNQDPLKDASNAVKNGVPPNTKTDFENALPKESYNLIQPEGGSLVFKVGKTTTFLIQLKGYMPAYDYSFSIENMADFPGAKLDAAGNFTWNPPSTMLAGSVYHKSFDAKVIIRATGKNGGTILTNSENILFHVETDATTVPSVKSIVFPPAIFNPLMIEEGNVRDVTVFAEDLDGQDTAGMKPTLVFSGLLAPYSAVRATRFTAATNQWEFDVRIDLGAADVTKTVQSAPLLVQVLNRLNKSSVPFKIDFTVLPRLGAALSTFNNATVFKLNVENKVPFTIYDAQGESIPTLISTGSLPLGAVISCEKTTRWFQQCVFEWTPNSIGGFSTILEIETRSSSLTDTRPPVKNIISIAYKVQ